jgi:D-glycero-alpha-D-manno-heptose-7-phosphate kinase
MIVVQTPLRISFLGGGTDFEDFYKVHGGAVLSTAIDKYVFVIVKERFDDFICVNYTQRERVEQVDNLKHELVREAMKITGVSKGIEITTLADVPAEGTGLGSSSSVSVGLLQALYAYYGEIKTAETLANEACDIEINRLKKPIGKQDQYIAAYGNMCFITFDNKIQVTRLNIPGDMKRKLNERLLCFYTGVTRKSSDILEEQKANITDKSAVLNEMCKLAIAGKAALETGELDEFGRLLHTSWELKKSLASKVSNSAIDEMYEASRKAGAIGGKISGAGGGGFLLLYCPKEKQDDIRNTLHLKELPFRFEKDGSKVIFNYRRTTW